MVQPDGNVVLYVDYVDYVDYYRIVPWSPGTHVPGGGNSARREFVLRDNGDLVVLKNENQIYSLSYKW